MDRGTWLSMLVLTGACCAGAGCARSGLALGGAGSGPEPGYDPESCRKLTLESEVSAVSIPGAVLLVFDRSGSMEEPWNGRPRWAAAGAAIANALQTQPETLTVGAVFFPSPDIVGAACTVNSIDGSDQIDFAPSPDFLAAFSGDVERGAQPRYTSLLGGMTPLGQALSVAQAALRNSPSRGVATVVIITDGQPTCGWDEEHATRVVREWHEAGIRTYVLGLPGLRSDAEPTLAGLAATGGTGTFITPDDAAAIEQRFSDILVQSMSVGFDSCSVDIDPPAQTPDGVHVVVSERGDQHELAPIDDQGERAFTVTADGATVELVGETCAAAMRGAYASIRIDFDCAQQLSALRADSTPAP